jgi:hypothetical protein
MLQFEEDQRPSGRSGHFWKIGDRYRVSQNLVNLGNAYQSDVEVRPCSRLLAGGGGYDDAGGDSEATHLEQKVANAAFAARRPEMPRPAYCLARLTAGPTLFR